MLKVLNLPWACVKTKAQAPSCLEEACAQHWDENTSLWKRKLTKYSYITIGKITDTFFAYLLLYILFNLAGVF